MEKEKKESEFITYPVSLKKETKTKFLEYCQKNGFSISKRIQILIQQDIEGKIKIG